MLQSATITSHLEHLGGLGPEIIEFGPPSGAASNLGLTIVTLADFSDYYYYDDCGDFLYNYNGQDFFIIIIVVFL